jgi:peptidoglycan/LPS O-acetylase OafA/YrhL
MKEPFTPENPILNNKLRGLDHLRSLAIIFVFMYHYGALFPHPQWSNTISRFGWTGVDLFFVLSGYLIASQLFAKIAQQKDIEFKVFFIKRFFRIVPAYLVVVALYFLFPSFHEREALAPLWKYLTFTQNLGLDIRTNGTFSHAWSLCVEEQFYLLLPLTLILLVKCNAIKKGFVVLPSLFITGILLRLYSWYSLVLPFANEPNSWVNWSKWIYYPTYCRLDGLLVGVSIAALFQFKTTIRDKVQRYGNHFLILSVVVLTGAYFLSKNMVSLNTTIYGFPLIAIGYGLMVVGAVSPTSFIYNLNSKISTNIAVLSYGIYLIHKFIIHITQAQFSKLNIEQDSNFMFFICIITTVLGAILLNRIIERPFSSLRDKLLIKIRPLKN